MEETTSLDRQCWRNSKFDDSDECMCLEDKMAFRDKITKIKADHGEFVQIYDGGDIIWYENSKYYLVYDCGITELRVKI